VRLTARQAVVICTGSRPALPELAGLAEARPWTNRHATESRTVPGRLAIVGGGGVGVEMASAWQGLGAQVTLLAQADGLLSRMEPFAGELIGRGLAEAGVDVRIGVTVTAIRRPGGAGPVTLTLEEGGEVEADEVLFATGRQPLTDDIGLDTIGLLPGSWLEVDDTCRVTALKGDGEMGGGWLYALGDINRHALLTHQGKYQARIATAAIAARAAGQPVDTSPWGPHAVTADHRAVPQVFFCDPPAGRRSHRRPGRTGRTPHPRRRRRPRPGGAGGGPARRRLHRPCPHGRGRRPRLPARRHLRRPRRGRADPLGHGRRGRPGPGQPALARRPLLPLHQRGLAPPARGLPAGRHR